MKINIVNRYCFKQANYGGIGTALEALAELQERHPDTDIRLEHNERSTRTKYRIVRMEEAEVELPEMPRPEDYAVPERPKAIAIPDEEIREEEVTEPSRGGRDRTSLQMTHMPTGTRVSRQTYYGGSIGKWERQYARDDLERLLDKTYDTRLNYWRERYGAYEMAMKEWREASYKVIKEAGKK